jgi:4-diphosphocytidyl-2-C-methyl-D-erythritol kinase
MRVLAPAKINIFLRITGRRPDGYHLLDSLMVPISLYDEIDLEARGVGCGAWTEKDPITVTCDDPLLPADETNLAYKAAALLGKETGVNARIVIALRKRIPAGAGLGVGSSDAAAVLKGLNVLLSLGFNEDRLRTLASQLGADVPFFIPCRPARVQGIGEILTPLPPLPVKWFVIIAPPFGVSTPWAYRRFDELLLQTDAVGNFALAKGHWPETGLFVNDLERAVIPAHPLIGELKARLLQSGAKAASMSGSGSAVFGMFHNYSLAEQAAKMLGETGKVFVVEHLNSF